jgi:probable HAF family extracellular repeat protein
MFKRKVHRPGEFPRWHVIRVAIAAVLVLALAPLATAGAQSPSTVVEESPFNVVEIGTLPGFDTSTGTGINESGQVVGTLRQGTKGTFGAFVWDRSSGLRALGTFPDRTIEGEPLNRLTTGAAINDRGEVAGTAFTGSAYDPGVAFRWSETGGFERVDTGRASGINNDRQVAGTLADQTPVRWDATGQRLSLGSLGTNEGSPTAINDGGQVVGYSRNTSGYARPFLWDPQTGLRDLGTFRSGSASGGTALGVNDLGHVVGRAASDDRIPSRAFLWRDGQLTAVGPAASSANAINNLDHVVGDFLVGGKNRRDPVRPHAFLSRDGTVTDLNSLIPTDGGIELNTAEAINDAGWIVANGKNQQGNTRTFVLIPR